MTESLPSDPEFLRGRYHRLAPWYVLFEWLLWLPWGIRERAVRLPDLRAGQCVLEVGCGTGRNIPFPEATAGPEGRIYGIEPSSSVFRTPTMMHRTRILENAWQQLRLGGRLVILEAKLMPGLIGKLQPRVPVMSPPPRFVLTIWTPTTSASRGRGLRPRTPA